MARRGDPKVTLTLRVTPAMRSELEKMAAEKALSLSTLVEQLIDAQLARGEESRLDAIERQLSEALDRIAALEQRGR